MYSAIPNYRQLSLEMNQLACLSFASPSAFTEPRSSLHTKSSSSLIRPRSSNNELWVGLLMPSPYFFITLHFSKITILHTLRLPIVPCCFASNELRTPFSATLNTSPWHQYVLMPACPFAPHGGAHRIEDQFKLSDWVGEVLNSECHCSWT